MRLPVDDHLYQEIGARSPQFVTSSGTTDVATSQTPSSVSSPFFPEPSLFNTTTPTQAPRNNTRAVRTIIEYFFLILALFIACILVFRRVFYLRKRHQHRSGLSTHYQEEALHGPRPFPRTTGLPRVSTRGYPLLDSYLLALPLPTAYTGTRRTRANDIDLDGRRFTSARAEVDHDGFLEDKDVLPKYETLGGPPKYTDLELQQIVDAGTITPSALVPTPPPPAARSPLEAPIQTTSSQDNNSRSVAIHASDSDPVPSTRP